MALSKSFSAQAALKTCDEHEMEELDMYCKTCGKPICAECLKQHHIKHDWSTMSKMARQLRSEITDRDRKISSQANAFFSGRRKVIEYVREKYDETMAGNTKNLEGARSEMHDLVDTIIDGNLEECQNHRAKIERKLVDLEAAYNPCERKIKKLTTFFRTGSQKYNDFDLVELYDNLRREVSHLESLPELTIGIFEQKYFLRRKPDKGSISSAIGSVLSRDSDCFTGTITKVAQLNLGETAIRCIDARSETEALMQIPKSVQLISINGDVKMTRPRDMLCYNFAISGAKIILCDVNTNEVKMIDKSDKCSVLFNTGLLHPTFVTATTAGELLISMWDEDSHSRTSSSHRLLKRMTMKGEVVCEYEYENDGITPLFNRTEKTVEYYNGDFSVIDNRCNYKNKISSVVYRFDFRGNVKFRYSGQPNIYPYNPLDLCSDMHGNTITTDSKNRNVQLIDTDGNFVRYLITPDLVSQDLYAVSLYGNKLWVGSYETGVVYAFEFNR